MASNLSEIKRRLKIKFLAKLMSLHRNGFLEDYLNELIPWLDPSDLPSPSRRAFTILDDLRLEDEKTTGSFLFSQEGNALFRAWIKWQLRLIEQGIIDPDQLEELEFLLD
jgi:hypothetical protein